MLAQGCGDKKDNEPVPEHAKPSPAPTSVSAMTAVELHAQYLRSPDPARLLHGKRVRVTGAVKVVRDGNPYRIILRGGPARQQLQLVFRDGGQAARARSVTPSMELAAECTVTGRLAMRLELSDCTL